MPHCLLHSSHCRPFPQHPDHLIPQLNPCLKAAFRITRHGAFVTEPCYCCVDRFRGRCIGIRDLTRNRACQQDMGKSGWLKSGDLKHRQPKFCNATCKYRCLPKKVSEHPKIQWKPRQQVATSNAQGTFPEPPKKAVLSPSKTLKVLRPPYIELLGTNDRDYVTT